MNKRKQPIEWDAEILVCSCGTDMQFMFQVKKPDGSEIFLHTCPSCSLAEESSVRYPNPVWRMK